MPSSSGWLIRGTWDPLNSPIISRGGAVGGCVAGRRSDLAFLPARRAHDAVPLRGDGGGGTIARPQP